MNKIVPVIAFVTGGVVGGGAAWYFLKSSYAKQSNEDIESAKDAFHIREAKLNSEIAILKKQLLDPILNQINENDKPDGVPTILNTEKTVDKADILSYTKGKYQQYSPQVPSNTSEKAELSDKKRPSEGPYLISPDEFQENEDYMTVSLTYYADGILADEYGVIIDDIEGMVGDAIEHFGDYEDDAVHCRNDLKRCDYEILLDGRRYADVRKHLPRNL